MTGDIGMNTRRTAAFARDTGLESVLAEVNTALKGSLTAPYSRPRHPVVLIMGCPRSGSTLALQWLARLGLFTTPSNLIARFYANPYLGARIQQILYDYDAGNQIGLKGEWDFASALGRTDGALNPSEYWYFWRQFFSFGEIQKMSAEAEAAADLDGFRTGLAGLEAAYSKAVAMKGMILNWHIPLLDKALDHVVFINIERDPFAIGQSLIHAREKFFGTRDRWFSYKPPEYTELKDRSVEEQVAGQVYYNTQAVRDGLDTVAPNRQITIRYEDFCAAPDTLLNLLKDRFTAQGFSLDTETTKTEPFRVSARVTLEPDSADALTTALKHYDFARGRA